MRFFKMATHDSPSRFPMAPVDRAWLRMDSPHNPMVINAVLTFHSPVNTSVWRERVKETFLSFSLFHCQPERCSYPQFWLKQSILDDYHFDIDYTHCRSKAQLQRMASEFINRPLQPDHPLWKMQLIPKYKRGSALLIRIHHAYADGMALLNVLLNMMDERAKYQQFNRINNYTNTFKSIAYINNLRSFIFNSNRCTDVLERIAELTVEVAKLGLWPQEQNLLKPPELSGQKQLVWSTLLKVNELKEVARSQKVKLNDILLSSTCGALGKLLQSKDQRSSWSAIRALIPVDLRPYLTAEELGNYFGLVFLSLPVGVKDPMVRTQMLHQRMMTLKSSKEAWLIYKLLSLTGQLPDLVEKELLRFFSSKASVVITNVPGPNHPVHFCGSQVDEILFWVPQAGDIGLGVSLFTYRNRVQFGVMSDRQVIPNPSRLIRDFHSDFKQIQRNPIIQPAIGQ